MKNISNYLDFINENVNDFNKVVNHFEEVINVLHQSRKFQEEINKYIELFYEIGKYLHKNNLLSKYDGKLKELQGLANQLRSHNKSDDKSNLLLKQIISKKDQLKSEILSKPGQEQKSSQQTTVSPGKEMSPKYPNMTRGEDKEIHSELRKLCLKYPENKQLQELQNSWYKEDNKSSDYDFWDDKMTEIFKKITN